MSKRPAGTAAGVRGEGGTGCREGLTQWRSKLLESAANVFGAEVSTPEPVIDVKVLHANIGELTLANDFLASALGKAGLLPGAKR